MKDQGDGRATAARKGGRKVKHPMRLIETNLRKVNAGAIAIGGALGRAGQALDRRMNPYFGSEQRLRDEVLKQFVRRLILALVELGVAAALQRAMPRRTPVQIYRFPGSRPVP